MCASDTLVDSVRIRARGYPTQLWFRSGGRWRTISLDKVKFGTDGHAWNLNDFKTIPLSFEMAKHQINAEEYEDLN